MRVRIKKTGQILNVEYDDDDLYKGWDGGAVWFYANEFDIIGDEDTDNQPLFTLTEEEVEKLEMDILPDSIEEYETHGQWSMERLEFCKNLLNRIKQWQDGQNKSINTSD